MVKFYLWENRIVCGQPLLMSIFVCTTIRPAVRLFVRPSVRTSVRQSIKFQGNPSSWTSTDTCGRADGQANVCEKANMRSSLSKRSHLTMQIYVYPCLKRNFGPGAQRNIYAHAIDNKVATKLKSGN